MLSGYAGDTLNRYGSDLYRRIREPHLYFLTNVRDEARHLTETRYAIEQVWGEPVAYKTEWIEHAREYYPYFS